MVKTKTVPLRETILGVEKTVSILKIRHRGNQESYTCFFTEPCHRKMVNAKDVPLRETTLEKLSFF